MTKGDMKKIENHLAGYPWVIPGPGGGYGKENFRQKICRGLLHGINRAQVAGKARPLLLGSLQGCREINLGALRLGL